MKFEFQFNREYELSELVSFVGDKIEAKEVTLDTYISTDNMLVDRGGVEPASKLPAVSRFNHYKVGDTLFSNIRTYFRKVWFADFEGGASPDVLIFRSNDSEILEPVYLYFLLSNEDFVNYTVLTAKGAKMPRGDKAAIMQYKIFLPDIEKQRIIGNDLLTINRKIELNRQTNQTLEQIAQAIFKYWFVDFEPVKAKIKAKQNDQDPELAAMCAISGKTEEQLKCLDKEALQQLKTTADLFPDALVGSELGEIPEGWENSKIRDVTEKVFSGGTPNTRTTEYWNGDYNWFSSGETRNKFVITTEKTITQSGVDNSSTKAAKYGDILIASAGQGHTRGQTSFCACDTYINQSVVVVSVDLKKCSHSWLFYNLKGRYEEMRMISDSHSIRGSLTTKLLAGMNIVLPTFELLVSFSYIIDSMSAKEINNLRDNQYLSELRDTLLPKLLSCNMNTDNSNSTTEDVA